MKIEELSLKEKIGQMFIVGLKDKNDMQTKKIIQQNKIGGVIVYKSNYSDYKEMIKYVNNIKNINSVNKVPIFISIDQEGGRVNRMPSEINNLKSATKIAKTNNKELVKKSGNIIGDMLRQTGINMNYAPILDIRRFKEKHPIGDRCYGESKEDVEQYAIDVMKEMEQQQVISVIKHFPGHGLTKKDSHFRIPKVKEKIDILEKEDMHPFEVAIKEGADAIMVGHLIINDIDKKYPASLSKKVIQKYLIEKYNYKGLIITDDFKMMAIRLHYNMKKATLRAIQAGNDIVMIGLSDKKVTKIINYIYKSVQKGKITEDRINQSVEKIINIKQKYNITNNEMQGIDIEKINKRIQEINEIAN